MFVHIPLTLPENPNSVHRTLAKRPRNSQVDRLCWADCGDDPCRSDLKILVRFRCSWVVWVCVLANMNGLASFTRTGLEVIRIAFVLCFRLWLAAVSVELRNY